MSHPPEKPLFLNREEPSPIPKLILVALIIGLLFSGNRWYGTCYAKSAIYPLKFTYLYPEQKVIMLPEGEYEVVSLDGAAVRGKKPEEIESILRGSPGSTVDIRIRMQSLKRAPVSARHIGFRYRKLAKNNWLMCPQPMTAELLNAKAGIIGIQPGQFYYMDDAKSEIGMRIEGVAAGGPAENAGLLKEDFIVAIDGSPLTDFLGALVEKQASAEKLYAEIINRIWGYPGLPVKLGVARLEGESVRTFDIEITRMLDPNLNR